MKKALLFTCSFVCSLIVSSQCIDQSMIDPEVICLGIWEPVCGCDGMTYSNSCEAQFYGGVTEWTEGECQQAPICLDLNNLDFGLCEMWLGFALIDGQCTGLSGCGYVIDEVDYSPFFFQEEIECQNSCEQEVTCTDLTGVDFGPCDMALGFAFVDGQCNSVSGCDYVVDNFDYSPYFFGSIDECVNSCESANICVDVGHVDFGTCKIWLGFAMYNGQCSGLGGCGYVVDETDYSPYFYTTLEDCQAVCGITKTCTDVAGIDFGTCASLLGYAMVDGQCAGISGCAFVADGVDYTPAFYANLSECYAACGAPQDCINEWQLEQGELIDCVGDWHPVCGCDSVTYANSCIAFFSGGVVTYSQGECDIKGENCQAIPNIIEFGDCEMALGWAYTENGCVETSGCGYVGQNGYDYTAYFFESEYQCINSCIDEVIIECIDENQINLNVLCPAINQPVCGCDSVTYQNDCVAYNHHGVTSWTMGECPTASIKNTVRDKISVYPNPTHSLLNVSLAKSFKGELLTMYEMTGKALLQQKINSAERLMIDINHLSSGVYILECVANDGSALHLQIIKK